MISEEKFEEICMTIIANSGSGRSLAHQAVQEAKDGNFNDSEKLLKQCEEDMKRAHVAHSELLRLDASGELKQTALSIHAQCHVMSSIVIQENSEQLVEVYKTIYNYKK